jgi:hypothetical protein
MEQTWGRILTFLATTQTKIKQTKKETHFTTHIKTTMEKESLSSFEFSK